VGVASVAYEVKLTSFDRKTRTAGHGSPREALRNFWDRVDDGIGSILGGRRGGYDDYDDDWRRRRDAQVEGVEGEPKPEAAPAAEVPAPQ
jgi:hypothetical protein